MAASKSTRKPVAKTAVKKVAGIKVSLFLFGEDGKEVSCKAGTSGADFRVKNGLEGLTVKHNGNSLLDTAILQNGDRLTVIPNSKGGGN